MGEESWFHIFWRSFKFFPWSVLNGALPSLARSRFKSDGAVLCGTTEKRCPTLLSLFDCLPGLSPVARVSARVGFTVTACSSGGTTTSALTQEIAIDYYIALRYNKFVEPNVLEGLMNKLTSSDLKLKSDELQTRLSALRLGPKAKHFPELSDANCQVEDDRMNAIHHRLREKWIVQMV